MKKLKRMHLNAANILSANELAAIEGGLTIDAEDYCTLETPDRPCVYSITNNANGSTVVIGTCRVNYTQVGSKIVPTSSSCVM